MALDQLQHGGKRDRAEGRLGNFVDLGQHGAERHVDGARSMTAGVTPGMGASVRARVRFARSVPRSCVRVEILEKRMMSISARRRTLPANR